MGKPSIRFVAENVRVVRCNRRDKVQLATVLGETERHAPNYLDVTAFDMDLDLSPGRSVTVKGDVSKSKPRHGDSEWKMQLVARTVEAGNEELTPAMPVQKEAAPAQEYKSGRLDDSDIPF